MCLSSLLLQLGEGRGRPSYLSLAVPHVTGGDVCTSRRRRRPFVFLGSLAGWLGLRGGNEEEEKRNIFPRRAGRTDIARTIYRRDARGIPACRRRRKRRRGERGRKQSDLEWSPFQSCTRWPSSKTHPSSIRVNLRAIWVWRSAVSRPVSARLFFFNLFCHTMVK